MIFPHSGHHVSSKSFGMIVARDGVEPPTPAFSELIFSSVSNNFNGCRGTAKHWKIRARLVDRGVIAAGDSISCAHLVAA